MPLDLGSQRLRDGAQTIVRRIECDKQAMAVSPAVSTPPAWVTSSRTPVWVIAIRSAVPVDTGAVRAVLADPSGEPEEFATRLATRLFGDTEPITWAVELTQR